MNFTALKEWIFDAGKLYPLGITDDHLHFAFGFIASILLYYLFRPIIRWLTYLRWNKVLTYMAVSFLLLIMFIFIELYQGIKGTGTMQFSDIASSTFAVFLFGIFLASAHLVSTIIQQIKQKRMKSISQHRKNA
jgi:polyferredoxin